MRNEVLILSEKSLSKVSASSRFLFKRCQQAYLFRYVDGLERKERDTTKLWFGRGIHDALAGWYIRGAKRGVHPSETWTSYVQETAGDVDFVNRLTDNDSDGLRDMEALGVALLDGYVQHYGEEEHIEVVATEQRFNLPFAGREVTGAFDLVVRDHSQDGEFMVWEHKTASRAGLEHSHHLPLDEQASLYTAMSTAWLRMYDLIGPKDFVTKVNYNYIVKKRPDQRPRNADGLVCNAPKKEHYLSIVSNLNFDIQHPNKLSLEALKEITDREGIVVFGEPSKVQPEPPYERVIAHRSRKEVVTNIQRLKDDIHIMDLVETGQLPALLNPTRECNYCEFAELCKLKQQQQELDMTNYVHR